MTALTPLRLSVLGIAIVAWMTLARVAVAQEVSLNYERLSSLEEPLAVEIGELTLTAGGLLDGALFHDAEDDGAAGAGFTGNLQIGALMQLSNRWRLGASYFGQYVARGLFDADAGDDDYADNAALSVGGSWGAALAGNVDGAVREETRRRRGVGNGALAFDDFLGGPGDLGAGYVGRFGPWVLAFVVDEEGRVDLGAVSQRPSSTRDYRLSLRASTGEGVAADGSHQFDTWGAGVVGELIYGSTIFDAGVGYESLTLNGPDADRWFVSAGVRRKTGALSLSLEGHYGRLAESDEVSAALGVQYDIARGLSANIGLNHASVAAAAGGVSIADTDETEAVLSMRYSF